MKNKNKLKITTREIKENGQNRVLETVHYEMMNRNRIKWKDNIKNYLNKDVLPERLINANANKNRNMEQNKKLVKPKNWLS